MAKLSTPRCASAVSSWVSLVRSPLFQAPPWTSTIVGNGPTPRGRYTRASQGVPSSCWYSTSLTSTSNVTVVAIRPSLHSYLTRRPRRHRRRNGGLSQSAREEDGYSYRDNHADDGCPEDAQ